MYKSIFRVNLKALIASTPYLLTTAFIGIGTLSAASAAFFKKPVSSSETSRQQIKQDVMKLGDLREINRLLRQMSAIYEQTQALSTLPVRKEELKKRLDNEYQQARIFLESFQKEWIAQRQASLNEVKKKKALKEEEIVRLATTLEQLENLRNQLLVHLGEQSLDTQMMILLLLQVAKPGGQNAADFMQNYQKLRNQLSTSYQQMQRMQQGIENLDTILQNVDTNPRFQQASSLALKKLKEAQQNLSNINSIYQTELKQVLEPLAQKSQALMKDFQAKAQAIQCPYLTGIGSGTKGVEQCRQQFLKRIGETAKKNKIQACLISVKSDDPAIEACAKEMGTSYLRLPLPKP